jgi:hypothetical protein
MNGLFDAPHDRASRQPKYADRSRAEALRVEPGEEIELSYGSDGRLFVIAATDNFGMLGRGTLVESLVRSEQGVKTQSAGAGVGLYILLNSANQLDVRVAPGRRTEVAVVLCLSRRFREFEQRGHSLNYFSEEG